MMRDPLFFFFLSYSPDSASLLLVLGTDTFLFTDCISSGSHETKKGTLHITREDGSNHPKMA